MKPRFTFHAHPLRLAIVSLSLFLCARVYAQDELIRFSHISIEQGLSQNTVICILRDHRGFIWFGTQGGLHRYDGYKFKVISYDPNDPSGLRTSNIACLYEDRSKNLWVGTSGGGLSLFDADDEKFITYTNEPGNASSLSNDSVNALFEDSRGILWVGTQNGLNQFDRRTKKFICFQSEPDNPKSLSHNTILSILEDSLGILWVGTQNGLNRFDRQKREFIRYASQPNNPDSLSHNTINALFEDKKGNLWVGTEFGLNQFDYKKERFYQWPRLSGQPNCLSDSLIRSICADEEEKIWVATPNGLNILDPNTGQVICYKNDPNDPNSLSDNSVLILYKGKAGNIWIGTQNGGINLYSPASKRFQIYRHKPGNPNSLIHKHVSAVFEDSEGRLWIGTRNGLTGINRRTQKYVHYVNDPNDPHSLSQNTVYSIVEDDAHRLWIGTLGGGINRFDPASGRFTRYLNDPKDPYSLSHNWVPFLYVDRSGVLWAGTRNGLNRFDPTTKRFIRYQADPNNPNSLSGNYVRSILEDRSGIFWIGTQDRGLNRFDTAQAQFTHYLFDPKNPHSLRHNFILSLCKDSKGNLWVGTAGGGLELFDRKTGQFIHFTTKNGLPNNVVYGIAEDRMGHLWLSTNHGLSRFNPETRTFKNYDVSDGLQSNEFNYNAFYKNRQGEIFFGGINGLNAFYPEKIKDNLQIPPVVITDFQLFNESIPIGKTADGRSFLEQSIITAKSIRLSYRDDVFSFEFAALNYISPQKNQYKYKMEGLEENWHEVGNRHFATYTHVPPGKYIFRVLGSNNDGIWNEEGVSLQVVITPPLWQRIWFRGLLAAAVLLSIFAFVKIRTRAILQRAHQLESKVEERTSDLKAANIELEQEIAVRKRTEQFLREREAELKDSLTEKEVLLKEIHHRVKNNMQIISSLLRLQSSQITDSKALQVFKDSQNRIKSMALIHESLYRSGDLARINFSDYIKRLTQHLFSIYTNGAKRVRLNLDVSNAFLDINRAIPCGLIVSELVTNALKHAFPKGSSGEITVHMHGDPTGKFELTVKDTGIGFPKNLDFHQTKTLGMQLVTGLVSQIDGTIELKREKGTEFLVRF
ncbi:MAG: two-component regulator propeller domain-containing protein [Candidatus Aminicenantales bacterium]